MTDYDFKQTAVAMYDEQELKEMMSVVAKSINMIRDLKIILNPKVSEQAEPVLRDATTLYNKLNDDLRMIQQMCQ
jgi:flagellin-specific chaperone FliS